MNAVKQGEVRVYVVFSAEEYEALEEMAIEHNREIRAEVRRCVAEAGERFQQSNVVRKLEKLRRTLENQAEGNLNDVFGEVCVLDDVVSVLGMTETERRRVLGERFWRWLDAPVGMPTAAGMSVVQVSNGQRMGGNGQSPGLEALTVNGERAALAGIRKETRQG